MAAKPPKPPGNFLNQHKTKNNNNNNSKQKTAIRNSKTVDKQLDTVDLSDNNKQDNNSTLSQLINVSETELPSTSSAAATTAAPIKSTNCNCTNISIMHLFHEMKQEFPTIPDTIVNQCVNENCHQRENCVQMLRNELALNPIPVQTYPAKVLHQQQRQKQQQQRPTKPLRPVRAAPTQPPLTPSTQALTNTVGPTGPPSATILKELRQKVKNLISDKDEPTATTTTTPPESKSDMPSSTATTTTNEMAVTKTTQSPIASLQPPRARPTTLNLQTQLQQQQKQQLHIQLQQQIQQRNQQQQQQQRPLRKAPLPPLPPKPAHLSNSPTATSSPLYQTQANNGQSNGNGDAALSCLASPLSSTESEISVNVSLSSPTTHQQQPLLKSPIRHRSVITLQPEPPYVRDFLLTSSNCTATTAATSSPLNSSNAFLSTGNSGQKSFTSVNLTLRQPNSAIPSSTIDISAGPAQSGTGAGLTYSSTSYDARRGFKKNFHITVTNGGGLFSASRIRNNNNKQTTATLCGGGAGEGAPEFDDRGGVTLRSREAGIGCSGGVITETEEGSNMCVPKETNAFSEILQRQKLRRDKLAHALRDKKKRLYQMNQDINILYDKIPPNDTQRLDNEIERLRSDCAQMLNLLENRRRSGPSQNFRSPFQATPTPTPTASSQSFLRQQQQQQRTPNSNSSTTRSSPASSLLGSPCSLLPQQQQLQQQQRSPHQVHLQQPLTDEEEYLSDSEEERHRRLTGIAQVLNPTILDTDDDNADADDDDDDEEPLEMWACSMCTFRNHPQLNMCECCENVRILPGTIRIISANNTTAADSATAAATSANAATATAINNNNSAAAATS